MLMANGEIVKVVPELMRHANCQCTLEIYSQARSQAKREAQHPVVEMIFSPEHERGKGAEVPAAKTERADRVLGADERFLGQCGPVICHNHGQREKFQALNGAVWGLTGRPEQ